MASKDFNGELNGVRYESKDEYLFIHWAFELQNAGYINKIERAPSFILTDPLVVTCKIGKKVRSKTILRGSSYTPEFRVLWSNKARGLVYDLDKLDTIPTEMFYGHGKGDGFLTYIEVKPKFDFKNMTRLFVNNQKYMYQRHGLYVNLVHIRDLFDQSFYPEAYFVTPKGQVRPRSKELLTIDEFIAAHEHSKSKE